MQKKSSNSSARRLPTFGLALRVFCLCWFRRDGKRARQPWWRRPLSGLHVFGWELQKKVLILYKNWFRPRRFTCCISNFCWWILIQTKRWCCLYFLWLPNTQSWIQKYIVYFLAYAINCEKIVNIYCCFQFSISYLST